ncbi:hypothetical protein F3Y22_tig00110597pilonHSYRG00102 [Hibiscus syriacus]|uniref:arginine--tRNA ligase n=1 Tax=Hibiscus syriacus TaxID=106335 RepID=A0A6A3A273_HIBSY|nr:hypothetical protein F3Y22_tig00110597pilonHSYRG00102 [Hibiscus syriacus]
MATEQNECMGSVKGQLAKLFDVSLKVTVPNEPDVKPLVAACNGKFGDYQWEGAQFRGPPAVGEAIKNDLSSSEMIESCSVAGPGFVNVVLSKNWMAKSIQKMLVEVWHPDFLFEKFPNFEDATETTIGDLQGGEDKYRRAWAQICEISRNEFHKGESFYNPCIPGVIETLTKQGLVEESQGARVTFIEGINIPLILVKSDVGFNYASTDLAALWYRLNKEKAERIIYVTDAAKRAGWLSHGDNSYPKASHVGLALFLEKMESVFEPNNFMVYALMQVLAVVNCKGEEWTEEEIESTAEAVGYGAVRKQLEGMKNEDCSSRQTSPQSYLTDVILQCCFQHSKGKDHSGLMAALQASVAQHLNELNTITTQLSSVEIEFDDEVRALILLSSLPDSWNATVTAVNSSSGNSKLKFDDVSEYGASFHSTPCREIIENYVSGDFGRVNLADDETLKIVGKRDIRLKLPNQTTWKLTGVRHIPGLKRNLISVGQLDGEGYSTTFSGCEWKITKGAFVIARDVGLFEDCIFGKQEKVSFAKIGKTPKTEKLELVHTDVWGPSPVPSLAGSLYYVTFIDDFTRKVCLFSEEKSEVFDTFRKWKAMVENETGLKVKRLRAMNRTLNERARSMRIHAGLPNFYGLKHQHCSLPDQPWALSSFECNLDAKSNKCVFVGYGGDEFGYRFWDYENRKIIRSRDVEDSVKLESSMKDEMDSLMSNQTWELSELPPDKKALYNKWIYRIKEEHDGTRRLHEAGNKNLCKLKKSLYGLKQAPRQWLIHARDYKLEAKIVEAVCYEDLGAAKQILRMRIKRDTKLGTLILSQAEYINKVLSRFNMQDAKPVSTPLGVHFRLSKEQPDIAQAVRAVNRYMNNPGKVHWEAVKWILRYLWGTTNKTLCFKGGDTILAGYVDADLAGNVDIRRITTRYVYTLGGTTVCWVSQLQKIVALSTTEAEYVVVTEANNEMDKAHTIAISFIRSLLEDGILKLEKISGAQNPADMLTKTGNTAVYLLYAHARICSIIRRSGKDIEELKNKGTLVLGHKDERDLGLHLLQFAEVRTKIQLAPCFLAWARFYRFSPRLSKRPAPICCRMFCATISIIYLKSSRSSIVTPNARLSGRILKQVVYCCVKQPPWLCEMLQSPGNHTYLQDLIFGTLETLRKVLCDLSICKFHGI